VGKINWGKMKTKKIRLYHILGRDEFINAVGRDGRGVREGVIGSEQRRHLLR
jgi:hypothetical protein